MYKYGKKLPGVDSAPTKMYSPTPTNFLGGAIKGIRRIANGAFSGGDGKFDLKDAGRLALGPAGMAIGAAKGAGMFKKDQEMVATPANKLCPGCSSGCKKCRNAAMKKRGCGSKY